MTDIEIAQQSTMLPIVEVAKSIGISEDQLENYGKYKAKVDIHALKDLPRKAKLVLVTAISPTPAGEGKTTTCLLYTSGAGGHEDGDRGLRSRGRHHQVCGRHHGHRGEY